MEVFFVDHLGKLNIKKVEIRRFSGLERTDGGVLVDHLGKLKIENVDI